MISDNELIAIAIMCGCALIGWVAFLIYSFSVISEEFRYGKSR